MFALFGHDPRQETPARRHQLRPVGKEKAGQRHSQKKLECSHAGIACKGKHDARQRLQMGSDLAQDRPNVGGGLIPELVELWTDERPILDLTWW
jgi:hypothetical protein